MPLVNGTCPDKFQGVRDAFETNFTKHNELGASLCVFTDGEKVVDLWGGHTDTKKTKAWDENTMSVVFSCTKAMVSLCAHLLIDRGQLSLDEPVATYWPEFAQNGKEACTVRHMLSHQSGVPAVRAPVKPGGYYDFDYMAKRLAREKPFWTPGTDAGYHMITFGWTVGELVRRVSGKSLGQFFHDEISAPLGADFHIGLPDREFPRMSKLVVFKPGAADIASDFVKGLMSNPMGIQFLALMNSGAHHPDLPAAWRAQIGGGGGIGNARAMATIFNALRDDTLLSDERRADMASVQIETDRDQTLLIPSRFGQGFMLSIDNRKTHSLPGHSAIMGSQAYGHVGAGGSITFYDPECDMSLAYSMNRMGGGILLNERGQNVVDAAYMAMGYSEIRDGAWQM